jgi:hypothetical protein
LNRTRRCPHAPTLRWTDATSSCSQEIRKQLASPLDDGNQRCAMQYP